MSDFKLIVSKIMELMSIQIPIFGYYFSIASIVISLSILSIAIGFVVKIFGGNK